MFYVERKCEKCDQSGHERDGVVVLGKWYHLRCGVQWMADLLATLLPGDRAR